MCIRDRVTESLKNHFRPEFLNRVDETIVFHELTKAEVTQIVDLMVARLKEQIEMQGMGLEVTVEAKHYLADRGYDPELGARPLRRAIQRLVEDLLSERLLLKEFTAGQIIVVDVDDEIVDETNSKIVFKAVEGFEPPSVEEFITAE